MLISLIKHLSCLKIDFTSHPCLLLFIYPKYTPDSASYEGGDYMFLPEGWTVASYCFSFILNLLVYLSQILQTYQ